MHDYTQVWTRKTTLVFTFFWQKKGLLDLFFGKRIDPPGKHSDCVKEGDEGVVGACEDAVEGAEDDASFFSLLEEPPTFWTSLRNDIDV